jgi:integrase/recombinase XerD
LIERIPAANVHTIGKAVSPHCFRHSFAVRALRHGGNVVSVSKLLGHASITTTQRYVDHLATTELLATVPPLPWVTVGP